MNPPSGRLDRRDKGTGRGRLFGKGINRHNRSGHSRCRCIIRFHWLAVGWRERIAHSGLDRRSLGGRSRLLWHDRIDGISGLVRWGGISRSWYRDGGLVAKQIAFARIGRRHGIGGGRRFVVKRIPRLVGRFRKRQGGARGARAPVDIVEQVGLFGRGLRYGLWCRFGRCRGSRRGLFLGFRCRRRNSLRTQESVRASPRAPGSARAPVRPLSQARVLEAEWAPLP